MKIPYEHITAAIQSVERELFFAGNQEAGFFETHHYGGWRMEFTAIWRDVECLDIDNCSYFRVPEYSLEGDTEEMSQIVKDNLDIQDFHNIRKRVFDFRVPEYSIALRAPYDHAWYKDNLDIQDFHNIRKRVFDGDRFWDIFELDMNALEDQT